MAPTYTCLCIQRLYTKIQPNRRSRTLQTVRVKSWLFDFQPFSGANLRHFQKATKVFSRPLIIFNFSGVLLSSLFSKNPSKYLKTAILPLKPMKGPKIDIFKEIAILRHFEWFLEKSEQSRPQLFFNFRWGQLSSLFSTNHCKCLKIAISLKSINFQHFEFTKCAGQARKFTQM